MKIGVAAFALLLYGNATGHAETYAPPEHPNEANVVVVTLDGFRWQELFSGADPAMLAEEQEAGNADLSRFAATDAETRRQKLMPFVWSHLAPRGRVLGNRTKGSRINVANVYALSYAGYNELFSGRPDLRIWNNSKRQNANITILEHLNKLPSLRNRVASFASWHLFDFIFNKKRSRLQVHTGNAAREKGGVQADAATFAAASRYLLEKRPRVLHLGLSGTDEAGHKRDYAEYLRQAHQADSLIAALWHTIQQLPGYRNNTTLIVTTDHGRGTSRGTWHEHGFFVRGSGQTWLAMMGSGIAPAGEHQQHEQLYAAQVAGTIGYLLRVNSFRSHTLPLTWFSGN